jgi:hypothetical protein
MSTFEFSCLFATTSAQLDRSLMRRAAHAIIAAGMSASDDAIDSAAGH